MYIESTVLQIQNSYPQSHIILAGDFNLLTESEVVIRTGLMPVVSQPTRGDRYLDRVYVSDLHYSDLKVVKSGAKSDYNGHRSVVRSGQEHSKQNKKQTHVQEAHGT